MALVTASSFGISRTPSFPMESNSCAIKLQINMTMPPNIPAKKMRVLMGKLQMRNYKFERRKPAILMLALRDASRHSRSSLSLTNPMKTPVLSLITALAIAAFFSSCQSQKKEETAATTSGTTTHAATAKKTSTTKKTSTSASTEASPSAKKTTKKKAAAEESASPTASPSATP